MPHDKTTAMSALTVSLSLLLFVALLITMLWGGWNWRSHHERQYATEKRGWRYHPPITSAILGRPFRLAGTTPSGAVWEMEPSRHNGRLAFLWRTKQAALPYGELHIMPRDVSLTNQTNLLRTIPIGSVAWQNQFKTFVTHDHLAETIITSALEHDLTAWPSWPAPGALAEIKITPKGLTIIAHQQSGWLGRDRLVALGDLLTAVLSKP